MGSAERNRFFIFVFVLLLSTTLEPATAQTCVRSDREALLAFVDGLIDNDGQLSSWNNNSTSDCCTTFVGVKCNARGRVITISFEAAAGSDDCDEDCLVINNKNPGSDLIGTTLSKLSSLQTLNLSFLYLDDVFPRRLSALKQLSFLSLRNLGFNGTINDDIGNIASLKYLSLNQFQGPLPDALCRLSNLRTLDFSQNVDSINTEPGGPIPACIGNLRKLQYLLLEANALTGPIPTSVKNLKALVSLKLTDNMLTGPIPAFLGELPLLEELFLQGNNWTGTIPESLSSLSNLRDLRIGRIGTTLTDQYSVYENVYVDITGTIPVKFGELFNLETLVIRGTRVTGTIPPFLGNLPKLADLELDHNSLSGTIPAELGNTNLTTLILNDNALVGSFPPSLGSLSNLNIFIASNNFLSGSIPESFTQLRFPGGGGYFDLSHNNLTGSIPTDLNFDPILLIFDLSFNNLVGELNPSSLWTIRTVILNNNQLTSLGEDTVPTDQDNIQINGLDVHSNLLQGPLPSWVFEVPYLATFDASRNQITEIPAFTGTGRSFSYFNLSRNQISGEISDEFTKVASLNTLDLSKNNLSGSIPRNFSSSFPYLNNLVLGENQLTGTIPDGIFESTFFNVLILNSNQLTGSIPSRSGNDFLNYVDVSDNLLTGAIPPSLFQNSGLLNVVKLSNNKLTGALPDITQSCGNLQQLIVEGNQLTGPVDGPSTANLSLCTSLQIYDVSENNFEGPLSPALGELTGLVILDVSNNLLSGSVDGGLFGGLSSLGVLDISGNDLNGSFPWVELSAGLTSLTAAGANESDVEILSFKAGAPLYSTSISFETLGGGIETGLLLVSAEFYLNTTAALDFSYNSFDGEVDASIGDLTELRSINLANNSFYGPIPPTIADIPNLMDLHLENNNFGGQIPPGLQDFPASSFTGNPALCGPPLPFKCR